MHEEYMRQALALAQEAAAHGEVPVGCVIVREGRIVGRGRNRREEKQHTSSHAEMEAIRQANEALGTWRLDDCALYVTLEPCPQRPHSTGLLRRTGSGDGCLRRGAEPVHGGLPPSAGAGGRGAGGGLPPGADGFLPKSPINGFSTFRLVVVSLVFVALLNLPA